MKITENVINDLIPLYAVNECSPDTRLLVEEYLRQNPARAAEIQRILMTPLPQSQPAGLEQAEVTALREARRRLGRQKWLMGLAIFFSLLPMAFVYANGKSWWLLRDAPGSAAVYGVIALILWVAYARERQHPRSL